ncbi:MULTISPECIES: ABC transporter ATP-binding protein [Tepidanaerobacter]|uniref:ABC transport system ATP-binding protein n=1 Tax=Tepidanaerobacter syntrophicus TaxID=224999 RepID=A0A0U9HSH4_9FIRM|nr:MULTISPECIES: ABC transporter ATP-binding protein [Tepidanaerobacter]GAQ26023.1 ABC transport system ATP-binding protein [Tepidanaerobacter syntrophicus]GLI19655.1 peptide ABC transporter ATP-binding protein [Tepidanaerobacter syntrophicus]GLI50356.1 peptide ABC transporter ATP-binding protein [Tepidanaerobacter syntrophicus]HHV82592.1 ABC transporter ATP-binding protein [Tepidanaerobacter syntrophicus]
MPLIELKNICRRYKNGQVFINALEDINLSIEEGEFVSIMGPSGSGKSTLLNILGCLDRPTSGTYEIAGRHVEKMSDNMLADIRNQLLGFVFQSFHLLPDLNSIENVELPLIYRGLSGSARRKRATAALEAVGLKERIYHRPSQLSGGEQQRVAIARAIAGDPKLLLADEPTGALDSKNSESIMAIFQDLNTKRGITVIQVTHEKSVAEYGHTIFHLKDGKIEHIENVANVTI